MQKKIITLSTLSVLVIFSGAWFSPAFGQTNTKTYTIKQDTYTFKMPVTQTVTIDTFVITEGSELIKETYNKKDKKNAQKNVILSTCLFHFNSSILISSEADKILAVLAKKISKKEIKETPLVVTGYTCSLGPKKYNQALSLQRAKAVADFLQTHGFVIATVQGKGSQNPVTNDPQQFRLNRRVTIQAVKK